MNAQAPQARQGLLTQASSPHLFVRSGVSRLTGTVVACLAPAALWGVAAFGWYAAAILAAAMLSALAAEALALRAVGRPWRWDGHALLVGLLVGMTMPPTVPLYIPAAAAVFAIAAVKWPLGGAGSAWIHPAAAGWAFAMLSWPREMGRFVAPSFFGGAGAPAPSADRAVGEWIAANPAGGMGPGDILAATGGGESAVGRSVTDFLNAAVFGPLGAALPSGYADALLGFGPGAIGQVGGVLLLIGSVVLISRKVVLWQLPAAFFAVFAALAYSLGGFAFGTGPFSGDVLYFTFHGSFLLVLFFVATDLSTSPLTASGHWLAGALLGLFCFLVAAVGRSTDSALVAVLLGNVLTSWVDRVTRNRRSRLRRIGDA